MIRHLKACVHPLKRLRKDKWVFPTTPDQREWCMLCSRIPKQPNTMIQHIAKEHGDDHKELRAWGFDWNLIWVQANASF